MFVVLVGWASQSTIADDDDDFFERKIRPVLVEHCYACHSGEGEQIEGGLRLDSRQAMRRGGESGPAIAPERAEDSLLIAALRYETLEMPPDKKLSDNIIRDFEQWIAQGAHDPREEITQPHEALESEIDYQQGREFWSFRAPVAQDLPTHGFGDWTQRRLDAFVAARLEQQGLRPPPLPRPAC